MAFTLGDIVGTGKCFYHSITHKVKLSYSGAWDDAAITINPLDSAVDFIPIAENNFGLLSLTADRLTGQLLFLMN